MASLCVVKGRAQIVDVRSGALVPYGRSENPASDTEKRPAEIQTPFANVYATVIPGQNAKLPDVVTSALSGAYAYPGFDLVFSVTSRMFGVAGDEHVDAGRALHALRRLNAHVKVDAIGADGTSVLPSTTTRPSVMTLMITPSELSYAKEGGPSEIFGTLNAAASFMGPVGSLVQAFAGAHHSTPSPTQVAYQSEDNEFGWNWYDTSEASVEGIHRCAALLQIPKEAAYVQISIDIITDWKDGGLWTKRYTFVVAVGSPRPASKKP
jgi:hypothetical protein